MTHPWPDSIPARILQLHSVALHTNLHGSHFYCEHCTWPETGIMVDYPCPTVLCLPSDMFPPDHQEENR